MKKTKSPYQEANKGQNVNCDFCKNVFNLLANTYGIPSDPQIQLNFPNNAEKIVNEDKSSSFQSRIVDLRLRRQQETLIQLQKEKNDAISSMIEEVYQKLRDNSDDIDDAFAAEKANRSDVPLYLRNTEYEIRNEERYQKARKSPHKPMNMKNITREYTNRLERSRVIGTTRAEKRVLKMQMHALENNVPNQNIVGQNDMYDDYDE